MQTNSKQPAMTTEANDSRTASDEAVVCKELLGHVALDRNLLRALGLSSETSKIVMDHIMELRSEIKRVKRITLLEASSEVAGHWNDRSTMVNQYEQAQRSAGVLQRQGYAIECPNDQAHVRRVKP